MTQSSFFSISRVSLQEKIAATFGMPKAQLRAEIIFQNIYKLYRFQKPVDTRRCERRVHNACGGTQAIQQRSVHRFLESVSQEKTHFADVSHDVNAWIFQHFSFEKPVTVFKTSVSEHDSSVKFLMQLADGKLVESVLIPERARLTLCVSTQVGCAQGCRFCQTGRMGLARSLTTAEIVGQLMAVEEWRKSNTNLSLSSYKKVTNIVYMGMGEPLDNLENVIESTKIFCDPKAFFLSHNKVTVSTVGMLPALSQILEQTPVAVALSLHSPFDEERSKLMPVNLRHPISEVIATLKEHIQKNTRRSFMVQYTMLRGVNDSLKHAQALVELLKDVGAKINLIPLNEHVGTAYRRPDLKNIYEFQQTLKNAGMVATIRLSKGRDIQAACGQLI